MTALERLLSERPTLHGGGPTPGTADWSLDAEALEWLAATAQPGWTTVETGCGYSTVALAEVGTAHTVISPSSDEHDAIRRWCARASVGLTTVRFETAGSQDTLPGLDVGPIDLLLVDGDHCFPYPVLDFFHGGRHLRRGGLLMVDDTQLPGPGLVADFCRSEAPTGRWREVTRIGRTAVFAKGFDGDFTFLPWRLQPWSNEEPSSPSLVSNLRARFRG